MARKFDNITEGEVTWLKPSQRVEIPIARARQLGLRVIDAVGGGAQFIGTERQYQEEIVAVGHIEVPGRRY